MSTTMVEIALLDLSVAEGSRAARSDETVEEYRRAMEEGATLPPVTVHHDGTRYWLSDGVHRVEAARLLGRDRIAARVLEGTRRHAVIYASVSNSEHGLPRSNADKRRVVERMLRDDEWGKLADREIARRCAVSNHLVAKIRAELSGNIPSQADAAPSAPATRMVQRGEQVYSMRVPAPDPEPALTAGDDETGTHGSRDESTAPPVLPTAERQIRPLTGLPPTEQRAAWREAVGEAREQGRSQPTGPEVEAVVKRRRVQVEPESEAHPDFGSAEDHAPDLVAELERAIAENDNLRAQIESLTATDKDQEIRRLMGLVERLNASHQGTLATLAAAKSDAVYGQRALTRIRGALGVERDRDILGAIRALQSAAAA